MFKDKKTEQKELDRNKVDMNFYNALKEYIKDQDLKNKENK
jgi:hypothetical protein